MIRLFHSNLQAFLMVAAHPISRVPLAFIRQTAQADAVAATSSNQLFEVQICNETDTAGFLGSLSRWNAKYRFKHLGTGLYLALAPQPQPHRDRAISTISEESTTKEPEEEADAPTAAHGTTFPISRRAAQHKEDGDAAQQQFELAPIDADAEPGLDEKSVFELEPTANVDANDAISSRGALMRLKCAGQWISCDPTQVR